MTLSLNTAIVRIRTASGRIAGAGFLVGERHVLTCVHVVDDALGRPRYTTEPPEAPVSLDFPLAAPGQQFTAQVDCWQPAREIDVAGLVLTGDLPATAKPARLVQADDPWGHAFRAFGFPEGYDNGVWASGRILGQEGTGWLQIEDVKQTGFFVQPGFSGGPVWDEQANGVIGMTVAGETRPGVRVAFIIPAERLVAAWPAIQVQQESEGRSLALNPFCDRGRINDPAHFFGRERILRELRQMLAAGNSISLVGDPQIGKSSLLYHLYLTREEWLSEARVLYLDLQGVLDEEDFCLELLERLETQGKGFRALRQALRGGQTLLLLDEVENLANPAFSPNLQGLLRALAQGPTLTLIVASHRPLVEVFPPREPTSPLHNIFTEKRLGPFTPDEAHAFLAWRLQGSGAEFESSEAEWLVRESAGHPARLQQLAGGLFDRKRR